MGIEFWPALQLHHVHHDGAEHGAVCRAFGINLREWVLTTPEPGEGVFAVAVLCAVCHATIHRQGSCPHERRGKRAAKRLAATYDGLRRPFLWGIMALVTCVLVLHLGFGAFIAWGNRRMLDTHWQELVTHSEEQKKEIQGMLDKAMDEAKESQIDREVKVKMWDEQMKTLTPQQRADLINKLRWQVNKAEQKRLEDQMSSSADQMDGKK